MEVHVSDLMKKKINKNIFSHMTLIFINSHVSFNDLINMKIFEDDQR